MPNDNSTMGEMTKVGTLYGSDLYIGSKDTRVVKNVTKYLENAYPKPKTDEELEEEVISLITKQS